MIKIIITAILVIVIFWIPFVFIGVYDLKWHGQWYSFPMFMTSLLSNGMMLSLLLYVITNKDKS